MPIHLSGEPHDIAALLHGLKNGPTPSGPASGAGTATLPPIDAEVVEPAPAPEPKQAPKAADAPEPKAADAPKPEAAEPKTEPKAEPKPSPKTPTPAAAAGDGKRVWNAGRIGTQLGVPPSAVRKLRAGEPIQGLKGLARAQWNAGQHWSGKGAEKLGSRLAEKGLLGIGKNSLRLAGKLLPGVGMAYAAYSAYRDFKSGDYIGASLNVLGAIPGPVGWVALGAATVWDLAGWGHKTFEEWAQPDGTNTHILPAAAKDVSGVRELDAGLRKAQAGVFSFLDGPTGIVWNSQPPAALRLDGKAATAAGAGSGTGGVALAAFSTVLPGGGSTTADGSIQQLATAYLGGISDLFADIDKALTSAGEQYFSEQRAALQPHLTAMAALKDGVQPLMSQLTAASDGAGTAYQAVVDANQSARKQLSESGSLTDQGPAQTMIAAVQTSSTQIAAANDKIGKLFASTAPAVVMARTGAPTGAAPAKPQTPATPAAVRPVAPVTASPAAVTPTSGTPSTPAKETPTKNDDDLSKLLSQLGKQNTPTSANPLGSGLGSGLGGGSPLGSGSGLGSGTGGGTPLSQSKPDTSTQAEPKKLVEDRPERRTEPRKLDDKSLSAPKPEQAKAAVPPAAEKPAVAPVAPVAAQAPAANPAVPQGKQAPAPTPQEPSKEVDVKGTKATFPDAKTAALAGILSKADPTHPVSLADAAKQAGLTPPVPGQDPGKQVAPADAKPGDVMVAGNKSYMLLGDGKFYDLSDYKVVGASEIPQNMGDRAGYFHLVDPNPGQAAGQAVPAAQMPPAAPTGPVSPQSTTGVSYPVPGATGAPQGPVAASHGVPAPAAPAGVPSVGSPGVPGKGSGGGPANAASTNTGTGIGGVSSGERDLDPNAVK